MTTLNFKPNAKLILADQTEFEGNFLGAQKQVSLGEVIFNTSVAGYQEVLTDPSYTNQIVTFAFPLVGSYGIDDVSDESNFVNVAGIVISNHEDYYSNAQSVISLDDYLKKHNITGISNINTRELTIHLRENGAQKGVITTIDQTYDDVKHLFEQDILSGLVYDVSVKNPMTYMPEKKGQRIVLYDFGLKANIRKELVKRGFEVIVINAKTSLEEALNYKPDAFFLSNGPGDPRELPELVAMVQEMIETRIPIFGICLGNQIACAALGMDIIKLQFGHHGINHPVKQDNGRVLITSQNHNYAPLENEKVVTSNVKITHRSLNDNSVEGISHKTQTIYTVQYHPEAGPGPSDATVYFDEIVEIMKGK